MIVLHHLNHSRSQRILWLLEELGVDYRLEDYKRDAVTHLAPPELRTIHPLGKSPVLEVDGRQLTESGAIVDYLCATYAPEMIPQPDTDAYFRHLELMHFAEGSAMTPILLALYVGRLKEAGAPLKPRIDEQLDSHFSYMESLVRPSGHFVLDQLSAADIMLSFPAEIAIMQGRGDALPGLAGFVEMAHARPAWKRALEKSGPYNYA